MESVRKHTIRESTERRLLVSAEHVFAQCGFEGASTTQIAEGAGLPKANVYYYFPSKLHLYRRVLEDLLDEWNSASDAFTASDDPVVAIGNYVRAKMALSLKRPFGSKVWANEIIHGAKHMQDILLTQLKPWMEARAVAINDWISRGLVDPIEPTTLLFMIWATTQHYADFEAQVQAIAGKRALQSKSFARTTDDVVAIILRGCGAKSPPRNAV